MFNFWHSSAPTDLLTSQLFDEDSFYEHFFKDIKKCKEELIIESPYITNYRGQQLRSVFQRLVNRGVKVYIFTRNPQEHDENLKIQAECEISELEIMGVQVLLCTGNHHRKLAIIDRGILWEGSLNILSQNHSREIMRRIQSKMLTMQMFNFLRLKKFL